MIELNDLLNRLNYDTSSHYRRTDGQVDLETAHLFRAARDAGVSGIYVFEASPIDKYKLLSPRPVVYMAQANTEDEARQIHRSLWNLGYAPFLLILLPHQVRIYTGFDYSEESKEQGLLDVANNLEHLADLLSDFKAHSIDTGLIWESKYYKEIDQDQRVDRRLLSNLEQLGKALEDSGLSNELAHALIGKYVYLNYLKSRGILTAEWIRQQQITPQDVFSPDANVASLKKLVVALEERFNGWIFPIDFQTEKTLEDKHVSWVASVFSGSEVIEGVPESVYQLCFSFRAYDFSYIPVETLSAIYEQFIRDRKEKGAIYTPEVLADYVLSEMEWAKPLERNMKVLDPACGSGVFLVLAYRRLIEKEICRSGLTEKLKPEMLRDILLESIYGIERERDACYVAEFSLILTLLHYTEPRDLNNLKFKFPPLHNKQIFECDFFDIEGKKNGAKFWQRGLKFDWITGNPPWIELKPDTEEVECVRAWIENPDNKQDRPVGGNRVAEAFSWLVTDLLNRDGLVGLVLPATSLFNRESGRFRQSFFTRHEVLQVTNFANIRDILFGREKSGVLPAMTMVYRPSVDSYHKSHIIHYGPFSVNQITTGRDKPWVITINESEIKSIPPYEAEQGEMLTWKLALWGTYRDKRALERIRHLFPNTLEDFCKQNEWGESLPREGAQLRGERESLRWFKANIKGQKKFDTKTYDAIKPRLRFSIPDGSVLQEIIDDVYIRTGKDTLYLTTPAPHVILSASWQNFAIYSDYDFVIPPRQMVISAPRAPKENEDYLRALTVYLSSSLVAYYLFFQVPQWGIFSQRGSVITKEVRKIPTPPFTTKQAKEFADFHRKLVERERYDKTRFVSDLLQRRKNFVQFNTAEGTSSLSKAIKTLTGKEKQDINRFILEKDEELQRDIDDKVHNLLGIPEDIKLLASEFVQTRLLLDKPSVRERITRKPTKEFLLAYARQLQKELDSFTTGTAYHRVNITYSNDLIQCVVEITKENAPFVVNEDSIKSGELTTAKLLEKLSQSLRERVSQWVYVQRGLRLYDGPKVYIYKAPRLVDWTRTQAMDDAADIIGQVITSV